METSPISLLFPRGPFNTTKGTTGCPNDFPLFEYRVEPLFGNWTFYELNTYISGACAMFATLVMWLLQILHATHFSRPKEQVKIIRIAHLIPSYSLISWFCVFKPKAYYYLYPGLDMVQSICMVSFFLLLCELVAPDENQRITFFTLIDITSRRDKKSEGRQYDTPEKKLVWYRRKWVAIFQYPPVSLLVVIITVITQALGHYCGNSLLPQYGHLWMFLLSNLSVSTAVTAILIMYSNLKSHLAHHRPLAKLSAIKLVVFLGFIQGILFQILQSTKVLQPNAKLTYADVKVGIPTLVTCVEMVPLALFSHFAYSYRAYIIGRDPQPPPDSQVAPRLPAVAYQGGFMGWRALVWALDPREFVGGIVFAFRMAGELQRGKSESLARSSS